MDNMHHLRAVLLRAQRLHPGRCLILFKSDITRAYRLILMHPLWQIHQVIIIEGERHVN